MYVVVEVGRRSLGVERVYWKEVVVEHMCWKVGVGVSMLVEEEHKC